MAFDPEKPFNDLPLLPPPLDVETKAVLKKTIAAGRALAELKGVGETIPNQTLLIDSLVLQEAKASSEVENIITTSDALFRAFAAKTSNIDPATKEVLRYREALWEGFNLLKRKQLLTTNLFIKVAQTIKQNSSGIRRTPGTKVANAATGEIVYTPPEKEAVLREKLKNLEEYIHDVNQVDPPCQTGDYPLPVRGDPPVYRRQWKDRPHRQHPLSGIQGIARFARSLPEQAHYRAEDRLLPSPSGSNEFRRLGALDSLHA